MERKFGRKGPDPVHLRNRFERVALPSGKVPPSVSYESNFGPVEDQQRVGACVPFTGTAIEEMMLHKHLGLNIDMSERASYSLVQQYREQNSQGQDVGSYFIDYIWVAQNVGYVKASDWPNQASAGPDYFNTVPTNLIQTDHPLKSWVRVGGSEDAHDNLVNTMERAIWSKGPLALGMFWPGDEAWMNCGSDGVVPNNPSDQADGGGHELVVVGYSQKRRAWRTRNHWGMWGDRGYFWLPYDLPAPFLPSDVYTIKV